MLTKQEMAGHGVAMTPHFVAGGCSMLYQVPAGTRIGQHAHKVAHESQLLLGTALVRRGGDITRHVAPDIVRIEAGVEHEIEGETEILWACTWPDAQGLLDAQEFAKAVEA